MQGVRRSNLDFVEGVIIGIYGNWLIALLDKVDFVSIQLEGFLLLILSFLAFSVYFLLVLSGKVQTSSMKNLILIGVHYGGWLYVYTSYGKFQNMYEKIAFSFIGLILFAILNYAENERMKNI